MSVNDTSFGAKQSIVLGGLIVKWLEDAAHWHTDGVVDGEFLAADVEGVECVGAVGAMFEEIFFLFGELFT